MEVFLSETFRKLWCISLEIRGRGVKQAIKVFHTRHHLPLSLSCNFTNKIFQYIRCVGIFGLQQYSEINFFWDTLSLFLLHLYHPSWFVRFSIRSSSTLVNLFCASDLGHFQRKKPITEMQKLRGFSGNI